MRRMTARNCKQRSKEQGSGRNTIIELDWQNKKTNSMLMETDWLKMLVDRVQNKGYVIRTDQA
jgi:hypothetical protein